MKGNADPIRRKEVFFLFILGIFFLVGFAGHILAQTRSLMLVLTPWMLLVCGLIALATTLREQGWPLLVWGIPTFCVTFALEAIGVATGSIFGAYRYGPVLGTHLWGVPPIIGFNWVLVVLGIARTVKSTLKVGHAALGAFLTALLCVSFDYILEPLAIKLDYWVWAGGVVPLKNYAAWFLIAYIFALPLWYFRRQPKSVVLQGYIGIQTVFFILVRLGLALVE